MTAGFRAPIRVNRALANLVMCRFAAGPGRARIASRIKGGWRGSASVFSLIALRSQAPRPARNQVSKADAVSSSSESVGTFAA